MIAEVIQTNYPKKRSCIVSWPSDNFKMCLLAWEYFADNLAPVIALVENDGDCFTVHLDHCDGVDFVKYLNNNSK